MNNRGTLLRSWNKPAGKKRSFQFGTDLFLKIGYDNKRRANGFYPKAREDVVYYRIQYIMPGK